MPKADFTDKEHAAVAALIRKTLRETKFPYNPDLKSLKTALLKLDPNSAPKPRPVPPPLPTGPMVRRKKSRR